MKRLACLIEAMVAHKNAVTLVIWLIVLLVVGVGEVALSTKGWVRPDNFLWNLVMYGLVAMATVTTTWILLAKQGGTESCRTGDLANRRSKS